MNKLERNQRVDTPKPKEVETLAKMGQSGWISVETGLPGRDGLDDDETEYVLVCTKGGVVTICGFELGGWSDWDNFGVVNTKCITHWMPMPEPPAM